MFDRFTDDARRMMGYARQEAQRFQHDYIDTEHLLLGLVRLDQGVAVQALRNLCLDLGKIRDETEKRVKLGPSVVTRGQIPFTLQAKRVLELTLEEASILGHNWIGTEHLLLGLIREHDGIAAGVLRSAQVVLDDARKKIRVLVDDPTAVNEEGEATVEPLVTEVQRLRGENATLKARIADLEARVRELESGSS